VRFRKWAWAALLASACASPGIAYHGGPRTVEVLGWDAAKERLYCQQIGHDESGGERNLLYYFDLRSNDPERPRVLEWSRQLPGSFKGESDSLFRLRLQSLQKGLRRVPIVDEHETSIVRGSVAAETTLVIDATRDSAKCVVIDASAWCWRGVPELRISTFGSQDIRCLRRYAIPGRPGRLLVLSYRGDPWEPEEVQRAVLLMRDPAVRTQVLDEPWGVR
jgi:hypothetical protein